MKLPIFQLDAFTSRLFRGNPASVVILGDWLPDETLQAIAAENNHPETAFVVPRPEHFDLRWFTPRVEMDLCGHATLAAAHVLFQHGYAPGERVVFRYSGGTLEVEPDGERLAMSFPARMPAPVSDRAEIERVARALRARPLEVHRARDLMAVFERQADVQALDPDFAAVAALDAFAVIATAPGDDCDFVSRFFAPGAGVPEDPVTGSAHCTLVPWWSRRLGKRALHARQLSPRGGELHCEDRGERVRLAGRVVEYLRGEIEV